MTDTVDLTVLGRRIERMDDQLRRIANRLDRIEGSIAIVDSHVGALTAEVHRFGERLDRYDERFDRLEQLLQTDRANTAPLHSFWSGPAVLKSIIRPDMVRETGHPMHGGADK